MITGIITFLVIFAVIGSILYGQRLVKTEKSDAVFGNPERAKGGVHWVIVGSSFLLLSWLYYSWDIAKSFYPKSANELCQVAKVNESLLSLKYLFPIEERQFKSTFVIKSENKNIDKLANEGMRFNNGYASSATCSPSRYALLTGTYPWRNPRAKIITGGSLIIDTTEMTIPKFLKTKGYHTGIVGKWHLGLGSGKIDYNGNITPGPNQVGFDYSHIMADTQDRVPSVYIENGYVVNLDPNDPIEVNFTHNKEKNDYGLPTGLKNPELTTMKWHHGHNGSIVNGVPRIGYMKGGENAKWSDIDMADHFLKKVQDYIKENKDKPFFLYYALQQPHVPRTPHPRFEGKSGMGPRGDVIIEADWCVGELYKTLESYGILENTLIIFTSDNGPVLNDGYYDDAVEKLGEHTPTGGLRGGKYSLFEAGSKVPFIAYWKGRIKPNAVSYTHLRAHET